jgi:hypothetical protein
MIESTQIIPMATPRIFPIVIDPEIVKIPLIGNVKIRNNVEK